MTKQELITALQLASQNVPDRNISRKDFERAAGVSHGHWRGIHWATWNDFKREAGLPVNKKRGRLYDDTVVLRLVPLIRRLRRLPTVAEMNLEHRNDPSFPDARTFNQFGDKIQLAERLIQFAKEDLDIADVVEACRDYITQDFERKEARNLVPVKGYVYLIKAGSSYKIGHSRSPYRRLFEIGLLLPIETSLVHTIPTDDPCGIETYWKNRFKHKRKAGEFFDLHSTDVRAFKKRRHFM